MYSIVENKKKTKIQLILSKSIKLFLQFRLPPFQHQELLQPHPLHIQQSKIFQPYEISNNLPKQHITGHTIPINQLMSQNIPQEHIQQSIYKPFLHNRFMHENQNFSHQQQQHNAEIHEKRTLDEYPYLPENGIFILLIKTYIFYYSSKKEQTNMGTKRTRNASI